MESQSKIDLAFQLLKEGKISRKKAWFISGLDYNEFMLEWTKLGAEETILSDEAIQKGFDLAMRIDLKKYLRDGNDMSMKEEKIRQKA
jgi:hypothetical protein